MAPRRPREIRVDVALNDRAVTISWNESDPHHRHAHVEHGAAAAAAFLRELLERAGARP